MIKFPCHCSHTFVVEDDKAGSVIQCPQCGLLNDVPTLSDLEHIETDGTYKMDASEEAQGPAASVGSAAAPRPAKPDALEQLRRAFARGTTDDDGREIDLRPTIDDVRRSGDMEIPHALHDQVLPGAPKYDPDTGEIIKPHTLTPSGFVDPTKIPVAKRTMNYASPDLHSGFSAVRAAITLLEPINLFVMSSVVFTHFVLLICMLILAYGFFLLAFLFLLVTALLSAHYAIIVNEVGPEGRDELPRPLRNCDWHDDLWGPFVHLFGGLLIAYAPAISTYCFLESDSIRYPLSIALACVGTFVFPAILLTTATSGTMLNLRPDRVVGVIVACGVRYLVAIALFVITTAIYYFGIHATAFLAFRRFLRARPPVPWHLHPIISITALFVGVYLAHYFCVFLGLLYRAYHDQFPWVFQRHIPTKLLDRLKSTEGSPDSSTPAAPIDARQRTLNLANDPHNQRRQPES